MEGASAADIVDGVLCAERGSAVVLVVGVSVVEENVIAACAGERWVERKTEGRLGPLDAGREVSEACASRAKTGGRAKRCGPRC